MEKILRNPACRGLGLFVAYLLAGEVGVAIRVISASSSYIWLPSGFGVAALVLWGRRYWPWILVAALAVHLTSARSLVGAVGLSIGNTLECCLSAWLITRFVAARPTLARLPEVFAYLFLAAGPGTLIGSALEVSALALAYPATRARYFPIWRAWWLADLLGELIIGGLLLAWINDPRRGSFRNWRARGELWGSLLLIAAVTAFIYTPLADFNHTLFIKPYLLAAVMVWTTLRLDLRGATLASLIVALVSVCGALQGFVAAVVAPPDERVVLHQLFLLTWTVTGLVLGASIREKQVALEARDEFLSIASHELKTPITSLGLQFQLLRRELVADGLASESASPSVAKSVGKSMSRLQRTQKELDRLLQTVDRLLDFSRIQNHHFDLRRTKVDLEGLIRGVRDRLEPGLVRANCTIELTLDPGIVGEWDAFQVEQVLENLVANAMKYAPGAPIRVAARLEGDRAVISVADGGPGIDENKQRYIFERFFRASDDGNVRGLGLGLFISKQIIESHGGSIEVASRRGEGARFVIRLPMVPPAVASPSEGPRRV